MPPEEIVRARKAGELDEYLAGRDPGRPTDEPASADKPTPRGDADQGARGGGANQLSADDVKLMTPGQIVRARREGRLDEYLGVER